MPSKTDTSGFRDLAPHQAALAERIASLRPGRSMLVCMATGTGKTRATAAGLRAVLDRAPASRVLIVSLRLELMEQWRKVLGDFENLDASVFGFAEYRRSQATTPADGNPWLSARIIITQTDLLERPERMKEVLEAGWTHVVLDLSALGEADGAPLEPLIRSGAAVICLTSVRPRDSSSFFDETFSREVETPGIIPEILTYAPTDEERKVSEGILRLCELLPGHLAGALKQRGESSLFAMEQFLRMSLGGDGGEMSKPGSAREQASFILYLLERVAVDSKWQCCKGLLKRKLKGKPKKTLLVAEDENTAHYLKTLVRGEGWPLRSPAYGDENLQGIYVAGPDTNYTYLRSFQIVIHYDLPLDGDVLRRRLQVRSAGFDLNSFPEHYVVVERGQADDVRAFWTELTGGRTT